MRLLFTLLALVLLLTPVASRQLTAIRVSEGDDLQAVLDAARPGDVILLQAGARFVGSFVLPDHGDVSSFVTIRTGAAVLPEPGRRTGPAYSGTLAVLQSPSASPALRTAPGAHHWRIENVEFRGNDGGYGDIIALGDGGAGQRLLESVPHTLVLDRVYVHGDANIGQKRGIALNSAATEIVNSHISDIKAVGQDAQAIAGWNGPGPYTIENNYLEAAAENVLFGGADPAIDGLIPQTIRIRRNHITRPASWRDPIVTAPGDVRATPSAAPGKVAAGVYTYRVVAERVVASAQRASSAASTAATAEIAADGGGVRVEWSPVAGASRYRVYRRGPDEGEVWWATDTTAFEDDGTPGTAGKPPASATRWSVKNLLELKNARDVEIDGNMFEYNWRAAQDGYAILIKPVNQDGGAPWSTIENVRFTNNVVRHVSSAINVNGIDTRHPSARARGILIRNNLFVDVSGEHWDGAGDFLKIGGAPADLVVEQNTVFNDGRIINVYGGKDAPKAEGFVFRANVVRHNRYGVKGQAAGIGRATIEQFFPNAVFEGNVIGGGRAAAYPGNHVVSEEAFDRLFVNAAAGDYHVRPGTPYSDAGVTIAALAAALDARTTGTAARETLRQSSR